jgi:signal peptidase I
MIPTILFFLILASHLISLPKIFAKAGVASWKGYIPFYNLVVWIKIMEKPWWWFLILLVPGVNFILFMVMNYELTRAFNRRDFAFGLLAIFAPFVAIPIIAFSDDRFIGCEKFAKNQKKPAGREWAETIVFAVIAASIIRTFVLEAFTIPTPSMEKSLRVGDFLFVSKLSYGPRLPMTPVSFPFAHHTLPLTQATPSFLEWYQLPYMRLPGFGAVKRGDAIVFNFPEGDTVATKMQESSYYSLKREVGKKALENQEIKDRRGVSVTGEIISRPFDKTDHYIKRCVAVAGDELEIKDGLVYINGQQEEFPETAMFSYIVFTKSKINNKLIKDRFDIYSNDIIPVANDAYSITLTEKDAEEFKKLPFVRSMVKNLKERGIYADKGDKSPIFPHSKNYDYTEDNFGPIIIPKKGSTVKLDLNTLPLYERAITAYEKNTLEVIDNQIFINGNLADSYTFKQDYYFAMGDNRHRSADSRFWGFVPHELMVGKAVFVWFSKDPEGPIRWNRLFSLVKNG